jgi:UDP-N-acetylglucosamine--N-acetylmuramyl-(pentapeptide) pyrophosphoryl-undecaprenol N-acetylglucosamine transferase
MAPEPTSQNDALIAMTGGGTAGHVFPGLAVAAELAKSWQGGIFWIGEGSGVERGLVERAGLRFRSIPAGKLRRYLSFRNLTDVAKIAAGVLASLAIFRKERPLLLFSKGGFVSVPPVLAARLLGIPCVTHESDFDPGLATRINAGSCERILVSFEQTLGFLPPAAAARAVVTGNPVRQEILGAEPARGRAFVGCPAGKPLVLVVGGSLGSSFLNGLVASCLDGLLQHAFVVHQMGERDFAPSAREGYFTAAFLSAEMPHLLAAADLVVCRAGANTLAELAVLGKPSVLVPLSTAGSRGDQLRNAEFFRAAGAAIVLPEPGADGSALLDAVTALLGDKERLAGLGRAARTLGKPDATARIAALIRERALERAAERAGQG